MILIHKALVAFFYAVGAVKALFHAPTLVARWARRWWTLDYGAPDPWNKTILDLKRACLCWALAASAWFLTTLLLMIHALY